MDELAVMASRIAIDPISGLANLAAQLALDPKRTINAEDLARLFRQAGAATAAAGAATAKAEGGHVGRSRCCHPWWRQRQRPSPWRQGRRWRELAYGGSRHRGGGGWAA